MPTIVLNEIECIDPRGRRDDMMLTLATDEGYHGLIWAPRACAKGIE